MAKRKTTRKATSKKTADNSESKSLSTLNFRDFYTGKSYTSLIYGAITVLVLFVLIVLGIRAISQNRGEVSDQAENTMDQRAEQNVYTVTEGETLWSIAEKQYGDGFAWQQIAQANNIQNPDALEKGTKLTIPQMEHAGHEQVSQAPTQAAAPTQMPAATSAQGNRISEAEYKINAGDTLWDIAIRAYGDGYKWPEIARANSLANPDLIFTGNNLKLPR